MKPEHRERDPVVRTEGITLTGHIAHRANPLPMLILFVVGGSLGAIVVLQPKPVVSSVSLGIALLALPLLVLLFSLWRKDPFYVLATMLLLLPLHAIAQSLLRRYAGLSGAADALFSAWKEIALFLLLALALVDRLVLKGQKLPRGRQVFWVLLFACWGILFILAAPSPGIGLFEYRNLFEGFLALFIVYILRPALGRARCIFDWIVVEAILISIWGVASEMLWGFRYLTLFGFMPPEATVEQLKYASVYTTNKLALQRANSVFIGPNEMGLYLACVLVFLLSFLIHERGGLSRRRRRLYYLAFAIIGIGELSTLSRNSWILLAVALGIIVAGSEHLRGKTRLFVGLFLGALLVFGLVPSLREYVVRTVTLQDTSARGRLTNLSESLQGIIAHPLGIGLGNASYKVLGRAPTSGHLHTEFYVFLVALELGIPGLVLYFIMVASMVRKCHWGLRSDSSLKRAFSTGAVALLSGTVVSQFFAAISLDLTFQLYLWTSVALAMWGAAKQRRGLNDSPIAS